MGGIFCTTYSIHALFGVGVYKGRKLKLAVLGLSEGRRTWDCTDNPSGPLILCAQKDWQQTVAKMPEFSASTGLNLTKFAASEWFGSKCDHILLFSILATRLQHPDNILGLAASLCALENPQISLRMLQRQLILLGIKLRECQVIWEAYCDLNESDSFLAM